MRKSYSIILCFLMCIPLLQAQQNTTDTSLQKQLTSKANEFKLFMDKMQRNYPKYVQLKKETETISLEKIKSLHNHSNTSFITYILNDKDGYGIFYSDQETYFFKINKANKKASTCGRGFFIIDFKNLIDGFLAYYSSV